MTNKIYVIFVIEFDFVLCLRLLNYELQIVNMRNLWMERITNSNGENQTEKRFTACSVN